MTQTRVRGRKWMDDTQSKAVFVLDKSYYKIITFNFVHESYCVTEWCWCTKLFLGRILFKISDIFWDVITTDTFVLSSYMLCMCYPVRHLMLRLGSDMWCQVYIDGTEHRHDGQVEERKACQLDPRGGAKQGRSHGEQHAHRPINPSSVALQDLPHWTKTVLSLCGGGMEMAWDKS